MSDWQITRHRVAIAGRVLDGNTGKPLADAAVCFTGMPAVLQKKLAITSLTYGNRWNGMRQRPDRTMTREDGLFYFLDLPNGKYTLSASMPAYGSRYGTAQQAGSVTRDAKGDTRITFVDLTLQPTTIKGKITGGGPKTLVVLAKVRVRGSGEGAFTDTKGLYTVAAIEPGKRVLVVSAQGYRAESRPFTLADPGTSQTLNISLTRESG